MKMSGATTPRPIKKKCMTGLATQAGRPTPDGMNQGGRPVSGS